ncbi:MAG: hypothetical protein Q4B13_01995 [Lautropia sp.]|nr:hypothetical protein [Lautropia sp.]
MASRLLVRFRTTVSSNTRGQRDRLLQATLLAQGFAMTEEDTPTPPLARDRIVSTTRADWQRASRTDHQTTVAPRLAAALPPARLRPTMSPGWSAISHRIDGQDIKQLLRSRGFADHEFRIRMEFQRGWGCL